MKLRKFQVYRWNFKGLFQINGEKIREFLRRIIIKPSQNIEEDEDYRVPEVEISNDEVAEGFRTMNGAEKNRNFTLESPRNLPRISYE